MQEATVSTTRGLEARGLQDLVKEQIAQPRPEPAGAPGSETARAEPNRQDAARADTMRAAVMRIPVTVQVVLGSTRLPVARAMAFSPGTVITLDQKLGEPVSLMVNGQEIARGEVMVIDEDTGQLGISILEISGGMTAAL